MKSKKIDLIDSFNSIIFCYVLTGIHVEIAYIPEDESSTGESDLDGVEDEPESGKSKNVGNKSTKIFEIGFSSSTVQIRSKGQAIRFKTGLKKLVHFFRLIFLSV